MEGLIRKLKAFWNSRGVACVPPQVILQITGRSSLRCHHCALEARGPGRRPFDELAPQRVLEFLPRLKGVRTLMLYGRGEPLLYPDLERVIWNARRHIRTVCITTTAAQLDRKRSVTLAVAGLSRLQVALDGLDPRYHRRVRGGDLLATLANLECFSRTTGLPVRLSPVVTAENIGGLHELLELKRRIPSLEAIHFQLVDGDHLEEEHGLSGRIPAGEMRSFKERVRARSREVGIETDAALLPDRPAEAVRSISPSYFRLSSSSSSAITTIPR